MQHTTGISFANGPILKLCSAGSGSGREKGFTTCMYNQCTVVTWFCRKPVQLAIIWISVARFPIFFSLPPRSEISIGAIALSAEMYSKVQTTHRQLMTGHTTAGEITARYLKNLRHLEPQLSSFLHVDEAGALQQAAAIDERLARGELVGPLAGVVMGIKVCKCRLCMSICQAR